jgi:hypothetical protein
MFSTNCQISSSKVTCSDGAKLWLWRHHRADVDCTIIVHQAAGRFWDSQSPFALQNIEGQEARKTLNVGNLPKMPALLSGLLERAGPEFVSII